MSGKRGNGEGSIYEYRNGYAAYAWVDTPDGKRKRKYVYGKTRAIVHEKWPKLHADARKGLWRPGIARWPPSSRTGSTPS